MTCRSSDPHSSKHSICESHHTVSSASQAMLYISHAISRNKGDCPFDEPLHRTSTAPHPTTQLPDATVPAAMMSWHANIEPPHKLNTTSQPPTKLCAHTAQFLAVLELDVPSGIRIIGSSAILAKLTSMTTTSLLPALPLSSSGTLEPCFPTHYYY